MNRRSRRLWGAISILFVLSGCATPERPDPWESMNRKVFVFNEALDEHAIEPVATVWDFVVPDIVQEAIGHFFTNLNMPIVFVNDVLQAKPKAAAWDVLRFVYNSTFGIAGLIDVATIVEIPENDEDFGQTLGYWGIPAGPYVMLPVLGPSSVRDGTGLVVDTAISSYGYLAPFWLHVAGLNGVETLATEAGFKTIDLINIRAAYSEEIEGSREDAFDFYVFMRNAYLQNRRARVRDQAEAALSEEEDLYFILDEDEELGEQGDHGDDDRL